mgnify:FL=1|tara:strand:- start:33 stop:407 length:375 start_codon:yes stop_codon:yes gene_type:complete
MTKNFSKEEFDCNDGSEMNIAIYHNMVKVANQLQILRNYIGKPITINSGYRSEEYNASIKGSSKKSQHVMGRAADITVKGMTPLAVHTTIELLIDKGDMLQGGLGLYDSFVHYDIRGTKVRFNG